MYCTIDGSYRPSYNKQDDIDILAHTEIEIIMQQQQGFAGVSLLLYKNIFEWVDIFRIRILGL